MDKIRAPIVADSSVMRKIVERSLRQAAVDLEKVVAASNGAEALAALQSNVVDLILCISTCRSWTDWNSPARWARWSAPKAWTLSS
ncbi:MAG TPA: hypothetical protein VIX14_03080 [Terriglobales bacterium]